MRYEHLIATIFGITKTMNSLITLIITSYMLYSAFGHQLFWLHAKDLLIIVVIPQSGKPLLRRGSPRNEFNDYYKCYQCKDAPEKPLLHNAFK